MAATTPKNMKIGPKTIACIFIGYAHNSNVYKFLVYESKNPNIQKNTIMESRNASFFEHVFPYRSKEGSSSLKQTYETMNEWSHGLEHWKKVQTEPRRGKRTRVEKSFVIEFLTYLLGNKSQNYEEVVNSSKGSFWKETIKSEVDSIL